MSFPLNYAIRDTQGALKGNLGWLFTMYYLHCDGVLRCYPSNELLKQETGIAHDATIQKHRDKLIAMKALIAVPIDKRITENEKKLHPRRFVYQITGIMELPDGKIIPTVYINSPEELTTQAALLEDLGFDTESFWKAFGKEKINEELEKDAAKNEGEVPSKIEATILQKLQDAKTEDEVFTSLPSKVNLQEEVESPPLPPSKRGRRERKPDTEIIDPELEAMVQAVKKECKQKNPKQTKAIAKILLCRYTGKDAGKNISRPITPTQLTAFMVDWDKKRNYKTGETLTRPRNQLSMQTNVDEWLEELEKKTSGVIPIDSTSRFNNHRQPTEADYKAPEYQLPPDWEQKLDAMTEKALAKVKSR